MKKNIIQIAIIALFLGLSPINHYINASQNTNTTANTNININKNDKIKLPEEAEDIDIKKEDKIVTPTKKTVYVTVTAYSSTPDQTDSTPFITANGTRVRDGIIAANFLPFGTEVRFPDYSGNKVYIVTDRMNRRFPNRADIWFETRQQALNFGVRKLKLEVL